MHKLPLEFQSVALANGDINMPWSLSSVSGLINCTIPIEFGGAGGASSPEDLYLQSAISCFIGTFKVIAKGSKLTFSDLKVSGRLIVDKNQSNQVIMKSIHLDIEVVNPNRADRLNLIVDKAIKSGFILNSIQTEVTYNLKTNAGAI